MNDMPNADELEDALVDAARGWAPRSGGTWAPETIEQLLTGAPQWDLVQPQITFALLEDIARRIVALEATQRTA